MPYVSPETAVRVDAKYASGKGGNEVVAPEDCRPTDNCSVETSSPAVEMGTKLCVQYVLDWLQGAHAEFNSDSKQSIEATERA